MALNTFRAGLLDSFIRSTLKARETSEPVIPSELDYFPAQVINYRTKLQANQCSTPGGLGDAQYELLMRHLRSRLSWKNLPIELVDEAGSTFLEINPVVNSPNTFGKGDSHDDDVNTYTVTHDNYNGMINTQDPMYQRVGQYTELVICAENAIGQMPPAACAPSGRPGQECDVWPANVGVRVTKAQWNITLIESGGWVTIGQHYTEDGDAFLLSGTISNDGEKRVTDVDIPGGRVRLVGITVEAAAGTATLIVGRWARSGRILSLSAVDQGLYAPLMRYTGFLSPSIERDQRVLISGSGIYDGSTLIQDAPWSFAGVYLINKLWSGNVSAGTWVNNAVEIVSSSSIPFFQIKLTIIGIVGHYDGDWTPTRVTSSRFRIEPIHFVGTDSGTWQRWGVRLNGNGIDTGALRSITITVSGTSKYDGTYTCDVEETGGNVGFFAFDDLNDIKFSGDATGTWVEVGVPTHTGVILSSEANYPSEPFASTQPDEDGTVTEIRSDAIRVTTDVATVLPTPTDGTHGVTIGREVNLVATIDGTSPPYSEDYEQDVARDVVGVPNAITFDVLGEYIETDTGTWGSN